MHIFYLSLISFLFYYLILRKNFFIGFKECYGLGFFLYIIIPLALVLLYESKLIINFENFEGFNTQVIIKIYYLAGTSLVFFILGYFSLKKKFKITKLKQNFYQSEIFLATLLSTLVIFYSINYIQPILVIFSLICLFLYKSNVSISKKIIFLIIFLIIFQYLSSNISGARRDIIKLLLIFCFFLSLIIQRKTLIFFIIFLTISSFFFVLLTTYIRTLKLGVFDNLNFNFFISFFEFVSYYDFMPAFDNLVFIVTNEDFLYGKTLFKILVAWIPREIWPTKPLDTTILIDQLRVNNFVGGTSFSVTLLGEIYWNFSWIGVFIISYLIGVFAKNLDLTKKYELTDMQLIVFASLNYLIFVMWRGGISTSIINFILNIFFILIVLYISRLVLKIKIKK